MTPSIPQLLADAVVVDFETKPILPRPAYPPEPVGVALREPGKRRGEYLAWGHPIGNTISKADAVRRLAAIWRSGRPLMFHNAKFDVDVAETHLDLPLPDVERVHCTSVGAFLHNPNSKRLDLKELAEDLCGMPPDERDELRDWIVANVPEAAKRKTKVGEFIWRAPPKLVGPYAIGDVDRTRALARVVLPFIVDTGMWERYRRKMRAAYLLLRLERDGVPVDAEMIANEIARAERLLEASDAWMRQHLGAPNLSVDSSEQLADALERAGAVDEWILTKTDRRSTSIDNLNEVLKDRAVFEVLSYRSKLVNGLRTFARPWLGMAAEAGKIFTVWNQVKHAESDRALGARTGRLSSTPNFQNVPKKPAPIVFTQADKDHWKEEGEDAFLLPRTFVTLARKLGVDVVDLLDPRAWIRAEHGQVIGVRDYSQQELRILAHYEGGELLEAYRKDPRMDLHEYARQLINRMLGTNYKRKPIKNTGFAIIYGQSIGRLAEQNGVDWHTGRELRRAYIQLFPGLGDVDAELKRRAAADEPIRTWGGRLYRVEPPAYSEKFGRVMSFEYKMLNTLIQGSAADCTEEAMLRYDAVRRDGRILLQVHDELVTTMVKGAVRSEMKLLREAMESVEFDLPMITDGKAGESWGGATEFDDRRKVA